MVPRQYISVVLFILPLYYLTRSFSRFYGLFHEHSGVAITQAEVVRGHAFGNSSYLGEGIGKEEEHKQVIPKIIHQVWHNWNGGEDRDLDNQTLPADWEKLRGTCKALNPGWEFRLWTEKTSREFLALNYSWFLKTYDGYRHPVQRADTIRYFIMRHYGGIYLDLDNGCNAPLKPLLALPVFITDSGTRSLPNNIMGATPSHPFFTLLTNSLPSYSYNYVFPYMTVAYASGQWFLTAIWEQYHGMVSIAASLNEEEGGEWEVLGVKSDMRLHRVMMEEGKEDEWALFSKGRGGSWVRWDNRVFGWVEDHVILVPLILGAWVVALLGVGVSILKFLKRFSRTETRGRARGRFVKLRGKEDDEV
ncbi:hypothetical protein HYFRA_00005208 [Hymenoscyphus fraxineus]|uniref:Glycosyltransferase family 32 protein n=1 Tax=Hymenoscyphus fraxineus TaxID=746836 RepID=A0A9N9LBV7_9HELO|nr:hypothetical protein HYFRA_00005208 [Hymenoscyphus fraxineus]